MDTKEKRAAAASNSDKKKFAIEKVESAISSVKNRAMRGPYFVNDRKKQAKEGS